jgi:hypothetical protein
LLVGEPDYPDPKESRGLPVQPGRILQSPVLLVYLAPRVLLGPRVILATPALRGRIRRCRVRRVTGETQEIREFRVFRAPRERIQPCPGHRVNREFRG